MTNEGDSTAAALQARVERLEAELVAAKAVIAETVRTQNLEVARLSPNSMFDRHGAVAIVFAIFVQTAGAIWWAAGLSAQVDQLKQGAMQRETAISNMARVVQDNAERLTRVQAVQEQVVKILDRHTTEMEKQYEEQNRFKGRSP